MHYHTSLKTSPPLEQVYSVREYVDWDGVPVEETCMQSHIDEVDRAGQGNGCVPCGGGRNEQAAARVEGHGIWK